MSHQLISQLADKIFSVSEYLELVNSILSPLAVEVVGEVTDLKILPQWTFFSLKDAEDGSLLRCGMHSAVYRRIGVPLDEGMQVKVFGYGKIAQKSGNFGFWVSRIEPVGEGALRRAYELLVKQLQGEGLFTRKRELPTFISHIGVISSRNGVVLQDLRNNLRNFGIRIDFLHSGVEGTDSAREILGAIEYFSHTRDMPQVLVLIRGGGSLESLQGFNNETVCRALFSSPIPVLVGIGHDVDAPIATLVADWSASTPTGVAQVINDTWAPLTEKTPMLGERIASRFERRIHGVMGNVPVWVQTIGTFFLRRIRTLEHRTELASRTAQHAVSRVVQNFARHEQILRLAWRHIPGRLREIEREGVLQVDIATEKFRVRARVIGKMVSEYERLLSARNPENILARGYGLIYGPGGTLVRSVDMVDVGATLKMRLHDGTITSKVEEKEY
ncbi:MAG: exodeoxyribonuclease VII large subunit [Candidatus Pacebacteria bacterium]|nr:exodeoxyribonuclease VII large subunit [Candidatus Paceibacterota bacterium]